MKGHVEDFDVTEPIQYIIPIWRIGLSIFLLILLLFASTILVCGTNMECRSHIPTLDNLLDSQFVAPFIVTALNSVLSLHLFVSAGIYYLASEHAFIMCKLQFLASVCVYISVAITLFIFPITDWDRNWANLGVLVTLAIWMICVIFSLRSHYRYKSSNYKRYYVNVQIVLAFLYGIFSIGYTVFRFFPGFASWFLIIEICIGVSIVGFLGLSILHVNSLRLAVSQWISELIISM